SQASLEQTQGIATANVAIGECSDVTQQNSSLVVEVIKSADVLNEQAVALRKSLSIYKVGEREHGTLEEAKALLDKAVAYIKAHGQQAFIDEANKGREGMFVERDLYVFAVSTDTLKYVVQPLNPRAIGLDCRATKDVNGRVFVKDLVDLAIRDGSASMEYQWNHPVTNEVKDKKSFVERVGNLVLACGAYKDVN
ncbi:MAG TPA: cache domain-containing protein, partial [Steroidobacteraceae bacterium]|nr:cache domain-containing protein [Steroidobacteraceae bacterium]